MKIAVLVFFILWMIVVWVGVGYALKLGWRAFKQDFRGRKVRMPAKVLEKKEETVYLPQIHSEAQVYELTFQCQDGTVVTFDVPERLFLHVLPGESGILVRHGGRFIAFEGPPGASEGEDDVYRRLIRQ